MTERLFDSDSYIQQFTCKVISLTEKDGKLLVETDRTAFFPEGGGQTSDRGCLGEVLIEDVQEIEGKIYHFAQASSSNRELLKVGTELTGRIDWEKRFSDMQQHSGEHLFSGIVHSLFGYNNVGFHLGTEIVTLDFDGVLNHDDICKVEQLVNKAVWDNIEVKVTFPSKQEAKAINYRSKKEIEGQLRLVEFPGVDICACCAPHIKMTGEIGIVEVVAFEKYKGGTRVSILCGERALRDIRLKLSQNHKISVLTCSKEKETAAAVERLKKEKEALDYEIVGLQREILSLKMKALENQARIIVFDESLTGKMLQEFALGIMERCSEFAACFCGKDGDYRYCLVSDKLDIAHVGKALNEKFNGRGGGRGGIIQGSLKGDEREIEAFLRSFGS